MSFWKRFWKLIAGLSVIVSLVVSLPILLCDNGEPVTETIVVEQPRFSEAVEDITLRLGVSGFTIKREQIYEEPWNGFFEPFNFGGFKPFRAYLYDGVLYADVKVYSGPNSPPMRIEKDVLYNKPSDWDVNYSSTALEIVNEELEPLYQFIYKTPSEILLYGIFPFPDDGYIYATEEKTFISLNTPLLEEFNLNRIFKYPSWKYRGQYK